MNNFTIYISFSRYSVGEFAISLRECPPELLNLFWVGNDIPENPDDRTMLAALPDGLTEDQKDHFEELMLAQLYAACDHCGARLRVNFLYPSNVALIAQKINLEALLQIDTTPFREPEAGIE